MAATLLGAVAPPDSALELNDPVMPDRLRLSSAASPAWRALRAKDGVRQGRAGAVLNVLADGARGGSEAAALVRDLLVADAVAAVTLWCLADDGSLQILGQVGYPSDTASAWQRIPLTVDIPATLALTANTAVFCTSASALVEEYPVLGAASIGHEALAAVPVPRADGPWGVIGLSWPDVQEFPESQRERLIGVVSRIGRAVLVDLTAATADTGRLVDVLALREGPWLVLQATDATLSGLVIEAASPQLPDAARWLGQRLLAVAPDLATQQPLADEILRLLHHPGRTSTVTPGPDSLPGRHPDRPLRLLRTGPRLILAW